MDFKKTGLFLLSVFGIALNFNFVGATFNIGVIGEGKNEIINLIQTTEKTVDIAAKDFNIIENWSQNDQIDAYIVCVPQNKCYSLSIAKRYFNRMLAQIAPGEKRLSDELSKKVIIVEICQGSRNPSCYDVLNPIYNLSMVADDRGFDVSNSTYSLTSSNLQNPDKLVSIINSKLDDMKRQKTNTEHGPMSRKRTNKNEIIYKL